MAIFLGSLAGIGWATSLVATRVALDKTKVSNEVGVITTLTTAGIVALIITLFARVEFDFPFTAIRNLIIIGVIAPGLTQLSYFAATRKLGPSRAGIFIGMAPIWAVLGAAIFTSGKLNLPIVLGMLVAFGASVLLVSESLKGSFGILGIVAGLYTGLGYGARDVVSDEVIGSESLNSALSSSVLWLAGIPPILIYWAISSQRKKRSADQSQNVRLSFSKFLFNLKYLAVPGIIQGLALPAQLEAFKRGRIEIISPISNSFAAIGTVLVAAVILGNQEWNKKVILSMLLIVGGAVIVGGFG